VLAALLALWLALCAVMLVHVIFDNGWLTSAALLFAASLIL
jgi:hypothetical protein